MQFNQLTRKNKNKRVVSVGRGGKRGKTSGRGTKGQKARSGHKMRPEIRDIIKRIPKLRGRGKNSLKTIQQDNFVLNLGALDLAYKAGEAVNKTTLKEKGIISTTEVGRPVKVLGGGALTKALTVSGLLVSASAKEKIEKAGGTVSA